MPEVRRTFVVQIHADGVTTLEDVATRERVAVARLAELGGLVADRLRGRKDMPAEGETRGSQQRPSQVEWEE